MNMQLVYTQQRSVEGAEASGPLQLALMEASRTAHVRLQDLDQP